MIKQHCPQNGNDGTTANMEATDQVSGQINGSFRFNATNEYVRLGTSAIMDARNAYTVEAWLRPYSTPGTSCTSG